MLVALGAANNRICSQLIPPPWQGALCVARLAENRIATFRTMEVSPPPSPGYKP
jgi:hypothetical protein